MVVLTTAESSLWRVLRIATSSATSSSSVIIRSLMLASSCTFALPTHAGSSGKVVLTTNLKSKIACSIATATIHSR